jgi:hypothetical protein
MRASLQTTIAAFMVALLPFSVLVPASSAAAKYKVLHSFGGGEDGRIPSGVPLLDRHGNVYGGTGGGGAYGYGRIYELVHRANRTWDESVVHDFADDGDSADPSGNLVSDTAGNMYGTAAGAGPGQGVIFELAPAGSGIWSFDVLYDQQFSPGLVVDSAGDLYGYIGSGQFQCGAIGQLSPGSGGWTYTQLYSFCSQRGGGDGWGPEFPMSWDGNGNLYGTTLYGGNSYSSGHMKSCPDGSGCGVAFQMTPKQDGTWTYHVMHRFANFKTDGQTPDGGLVLDASGKTYGVTAYGGVHDNGTIFKMTPASGGRWKQTVLYDFPNCADGCLPGGTMVFDNSGALYGVAGGGGGNCGDTCGVVFKLAPQKNGKWKYSVMHKFSGPDGGFPWGVTIDDKGNLYGTTQAFGKYGAGVAFEITQ